MAIFTRRQLQTMLDAFGPWLTPAKGRDLLHRLDHRDDPDQALPAEYELALGWALSQRSDHVVVEPRVGSAQPDFLATGLFGTRPALIEVVALSDDALSGESSMERTANILNAFANRVRRGASRHLHYQFLDASGYRPGRRVGPFAISQYFRERLTSHDFALLPEHERQLRAWLAATPPTVALRIEGEGTVVVVTWQPQVHPMANTFSTMPSLAHSLTDNPIYKRLKEKERKQLKAAPASYLRCLFVGDAGCGLLRDPNRRDLLNRYVSGSEIIRQFLRDSSVDVVAVFSPRREIENSADLRRHPRIWHCFAYDRGGFPDEFWSPLRGITELLPAPRLHGYQARSWVRQGMLAPQGRGQYKGPTYISGRVGVTAKISARALLELMAGRLSADKFRDWAVDQNNNHFERWLSQGYAIRDVTFEACGDEDDDYVCFRLEPDPNASPLRAPASSRSVENGDETS